MLAACTLLREGVHAIVGPSWSSTTAHVLQITSSFAVPTISYSATSPTIGDDTAHPYFARVPPSDALQAPAMVAVARHFDWTRTCIIYQDDTYGTNGALATRIAATRDGGVVLSMEGYDAESKDASAAITRAKASGCRIFLHWCVECHLSMGYAHNASVLDGGNYVWILSDGCGDAIAAPDVWAHRGGTSSYQAAMVGTLCLNPSAPPGAGRAELLNRWTAAGRTDTPSPYSVYAHDAMLLAAHAVAAVPASIPQPFRLFDNQSCVPDADEASAPSAWAYGSDVADAMKATSFVGATSGSGVVSFYDSLERANVSYSLYNFQSNIETISNDDGRYQMVAKVNIEYGADPSQPTAIVDPIAPVMWSANEKFGSKVPSDTLPRKVKVMTVNSPPYVEFEEKCKDDPCTLCTAQQCSCPQDCYIGHAIQVWTQCPRWVKASIIQSTTLDTTKATMDAVRQSR